MTKTAYGLINEVDQKSIDIADELIQQMKSKLQELTEDHDETQGQLNDCMFTLNTLSGMKEAMQGVLKANAVLTELGYTWGEVFTQDPEHSVEGRYIKVLDLALASTLFARTRLNTDLALIEVPNYLTYSPFPNLAHHASYVMSLITVLAPFSVIDKRLSLYRVGYGNTPATSLFISVDVNTGLSSLREIGAENKEVHFKEFELGGAADLFEYIRDNYRSNLG